MTRSTERVALVTGGSRGVGRAVVRRLAADGHTVVFSYRKDRDAADTVISDVEKEGGKAVALPADLRQPGAATALAEEALAAVGPVSVLVSNAGMASRGLSVAETSRDEYLSFFQLNALVITELAGAVLPGMRVAGAGSIVVISSTVTSSLPPYTGPYAAAKSAGEALVRVLALEERAHGIRVNSLAPGLIATDMGDRLVKANVDGARVSDLDAGHPFKRVCRPGDVAAAVAYLTEPDNYVTGHRLVIDGGGPSNQIY
ncbi:SDR family NAD(P)-dependent oxidoreductase [Streptomyces sp. NPDC057199]|uniref:SDR family NAD(P)-dependent oxidoreductase n=1 Tax=Streptomyces sp. NPDC057199 TaxID=3346047 RepID=UPI003632D8DC